MTSDTCVHQWGGIYISPEGYLIQCGISKEIVCGDKPPHINDVEDLQEFYRGEYFNKLRNTPVTDNQYCIACTRREKNGVKSLRNMMVKTYKDNSIPFDDTIRHLDVCFSNLCNQQCLMCKSESSSRWYVDDKKWANTEFARRPVMYLDWSKKNLHKIIKILPDLHLISIKGGEPSIQSEVKHILKYLTDNNLNPRIEMISNMQQVSLETMKLFCAQKNMYLRISMDASGIMYDWTRGGNYSKTLSNISKYIENCDHTPKIGFTNTLNRWSYKSLVEDILKIEKFISTFDLPSVNYNIQPVMGPRYTSPFAAPREERLALVNHFEKHFGIIENDSIVYKSLRINHLNNVLSLENEVYDDEGLMEKSDRWKEFIDSIR